MKRKLFTLFLITCLLCQILPVSVFAFNFAKAERFVVQILCDDTIDLSQVELMIYEEIGATTEKDGSESVHEDYTFSVFTDSKGSASFELPEKRFSVNLNLETLPDGYGADTYTKYFGNGEKNGSFTVSKIASAEIVKSDTGYTLAAYAENGFPLTIDSEVTVTPAVIQAATPKTFTEYSRYNSSAYQVTATYGSKVLTKRVTEDLSAKTAVEKSEYLYNAGLISQSEHIRVLCEQLTSEDNWGGEAQCCGTTVMAEITAYAENMSEDDPNYEIIAATVQGRNGETQSDDPQYVNNGNVYYPSSTASFRIHYGTMLTEDGISVPAGTLSQAKAVYDELVKIRQFFYVEAALRAPIGYFSTAVYDVFIVHDNYFEASAMTYSFGSCESYICIPLNTANAIYNEENHAYGALAHEYIHGIMLAYDIIPAEDSIANTASCDDVFWMHESFATFLGCLYSIGREYASYSAFETAYFSDNYIYNAQNGDFPFSMNSAVIDFLSTQHLELTNISDNREYGALFFPMYLYNREKSISVFQRLFYRYQYYDDPILTINDYGLAFESYIDAFYSWVFQPSINANIYCTEWGMTQPYELVNSYPYSIPRTSTRSLSCNWREFIAPGNSMYTINVTTSIYGYTSSTKASVLTKYSTPNGTYLGPYNKMITSQMVSTRTSFGSTYADYWIGFVNRGSSCTYYQTASITLISS